MVAQLARLTAEQFLFLEEAFAVSWALAAAGELGVLERLDAGPVVDQAALHGLSVEEST